MLFFGLNITRGTNYARETNSAHASRDSSGMGRAKRVKPVSEAEQWLHKDDDPPGFEIKCFPGKGRGIVTTQWRSAGAFLLHYAGETISAAEGERRECIPTGFRFFFTSGGKKLCTDASRESGRLGRLVNHGNKNERNASMKEIQGQLVLFATRDIEVGEEITYDYGLAELPWEKAEVKAREIKAQKGSYDSSQKIEARIEKDDPAQCIEASAREMEVQKGEDNSAQETKAQKWGQDPAKEMAVQKGEGDTAKEVEARIVEDDLSQKMDAQKEEDNTAQEMVAQKGGQDSADEMAAQKRGQDTAGEMEGSNAQKGGQDPAQEMEVQKGGQDLAEEIKVQIDEGVTAEELEAQIFGQDQAQEEVQIGEGVTAEEMEAQKGGQHLAEEIEAQKGAQDPAEEMEAQKWGQDPAEEMEVQNGGQDPAEEIEAQKGRQHPAEEMEVRNGGQDPAEEMEAQKGRQDPAQEMEDQKGGQDPGEVIEVQKGRQDPAQEMEVPKGGQNPAEVMEVQKGRQDPAQEMEVRNGGQDPGEVMEAQKGGQDPAQQMEDRKGGQDPGEVIEVQKGGQDPAQEMEVQKGGQDPVQKIEVQKGVQDPAQEMEVQIGEDVSAKEIEAQKGEYDQSQEMAEKGGQDPAEEMESQKGEDNSAREMEAQKGGQDPAKKMEVQKGVQNPAQEMEIRIGEGVTAKEIEAQIGEDDQVHYMETQNGERDAAQDIEAQKGGYDPAHKMKAHKKDGGPVQEIEAQTGKVDTALEIKAQKEESCTAQEIKAQKREYGTAEEIGAQKLGHDQAQEVKAQRRKVYLAQVIKTRQGEELATPEIKAQKEEKCKDVEQKQTRGKQEYCHQSSSEIDREPEPAGVVTVFIDHDDHTDPHDLLLNVVGSAGDPHLETVSDSEASEIIEVQGPIKVSADSTTGSIPEKEEIVIQTVTDSEKRDYSKKHCCFFCEKSVSKMARHLEKAHQDVPEIGQLPSTSKENSADDSAKRKRVFAKYRNLGNFNHNISVLIKKNGVFYVGRRPAQEKGSSASNYLPCPYCLTFFVKGELWRHVKTCSFKEEKINVSNAVEVKKSADDCVRSAEYILQGALGTDVFGSDSEEFIDHVVKRFHMDDVSRAVKNDKLLLLFGKVQLRKLGLQRACQVREKLRILGRVKIELRSLTGLESADIDDFITPSKFDICLKAVGNMSGESTEGSSTGTRTFKKPSLALKAGQLLKKIAVLKRGQAIRKLEISKKDETDQFISLYTEEFSEAVSSLAHHTLSERKYNKKVLLPLTEDLLKYVNYLETTTVERTSLLLDCPCASHWNALAEVTVARVILFNKRRASEGSKMLTSQFVGRPAWGRENQELVSTLQPIEKHLMKTMSLVEVVGKQYKRVPVLLTKTMVAAIQALVDKRAEGGVKSCNPHVFAQGDSNFKRGSDCIRRTVQACELQFPERITSTKLRKYLATVSQVFNLSESELGELARHMGHELSVHRRFYRLQDDVIELAKVSRLLMSIEEGKAAQFAGRSLDDINLEDFEESEEEDGENDEDGAEEDFDLQPDEDDVPSKAPPSKKTMVQDLQSDTDDDNVPCKAPPSKKRMVQDLQSDTAEDDVPCKAPPSKKRMVQVSKKRIWSSLEKVQMQPLVQEAVRKKKPPCKAEVVRFQLTNGDTNLKSLPWLKLKHQVWAIAQTEMKKKEKVVAELLP